MTECILVTNIWTLLWRYYSTHINCGSGWQTEDTPDWCLSKAQSLTRHIVSNATFICHPAPQQVVWSDSVWEEHCWQAVLGFADKDINPYLTTRRLINLNRRGTQEVSQWGNEWKPSTKTDAALAFMSSCVVAFCLIAERSCVIMMANYVGVNTVLVQSCVCVCVRVSYQWFWCADTDCLTWSWGGMWHASRWTVQPALFWSGRCRHRWPAHLRCCCQAVRRRPHHKLSRWHHGG